MQVLTGEKGAFSVRDYFMHHQVFCNKSVAWTARSLLERKWLQVRLKRWHIIIITDNGKRKRSAIIALLFTLLRHPVTRGQGCCWRSAPDHGADRRVTNNSKEEGRGRPRERKELFTDRRACICCLDVKNPMKKRRAFIARYAGVGVFVHWRLWAAASLCPPSMQLPCLQRLPAEISHKEGELRTNESACCHHGGWNSFGRSKEVNCLLKKKTNLQLIDHDKMSIVKVAEWRSNPVVWEKQHLWIYGCCRLHLFSFYKDT